MKSGWSCTRPQSGLAALAKSRPSWRDSVISNPSFFQPKTSYAFLVCAGSHPTTSHQHFPWLWPIESHISIVPISHFSIFSQMAYDGSRLTEVPPTPSFSERELAATSQPCLSGHTSRPYIHRSSKLAASASAPRLLTNRCHGMLCHYSILGPPGCEMGHGNTRKPTHPQLSFSPSGSRELVELVIDGELCDPIAYPPTTSSFFYLCSKDRSFGIFHLLIYTTFRQAKFTFSFSLHTISLS